MTSFQTQSNPYSFGGQVSAAEASIEARARFLQKTYSWLMAGVLGFCCVMAAWSEVPALQSLTNALFGNWLITVVVLFALTFGVHAVAQRFPLNIVAYGVYVLVFGLLIAPLVELAGEGLVTQAALITGMTFVGLTAYVFISGKDFAFLGGILFAGLLGLMGFAIAGLIFGFSMGTGFSLIAALLFCGYILYDTGQILHHYPTTAHISAAIVLFTDVILLFKHILILLMSNRD